MRTVLLILIIAVSLPVFAQKSGSAGALTPHAIVELAWQEMHVEDLSGLGRQVIKGQFDDRTALANPQLSVGAGTVGNSLGLKANYSEWGVSQRFSVSGWKNRLQEQKQLALNLSGLESEQRKLRIAEEALLLAYNYKVQKEKEDHVQFRLKRLRKLRTYLNTRPFPSPQQKVELEFIKAKIAEVSIDVDFITRDLRSSEQAIKIFLGLEKMPKLHLPWKNERELTAMLQTLKNQRSIEIKKKENLVRQTEKVKSAESVKWIPDLNFFYSYSEEKYLGGNKNNTFGLSFDIPIFNQQRSISRSLAAQTKILKLEQLKIQREEKIRKDSDVILLEKCLMVLKYYTKDYIREKEKALNQATENFDRGLITANQYIDFEEKVHFIHSARLENIQRSHALILKAMKRWGSEKQLLGYL